MKGLKRKAIRFAGSALISSLLLGTLGSSAASAAVVIPCTISGTTIRVGNYAQHIYYGQSGNFSCGANPEGLTYATVTVYVYRYDGGRFGPGGQLVDTAAMNTSRSFAPTPAIRATSRLIGCGAGNYMRAVVHFGVAGTSALSGNWSYFSGWRACS
jgi:hypothetical protein